MGKDSRGVVGPDFKSTNSVIECQSAPVPERAGRALVRKSLGLQSHPRLHAAISVKHHGHAISCEALLRLG